MLLDLVHEQHKRRMPKDIERYVRENYGPCDSDEDAVQTDHNRQRDEREYRRRPPLRKCASDYERNYLDDIANSPSKRSATPLHFGITESGAATGGGGDGEGEEERRSSSRKVLEEEHLRSLYMESSVVTEVFGGAIRSTVTCSQCGTRSHTVENTFDLSVPIPNEPVPVPGDEGDSGLKIGNGSVAAGGAAEKSSGGFFGLGRSGAGGSTSSSSTHGGGGRFSSLFSHVSTHVKGLFFDKGVSVEDCIRKFTEPESLIGKEQYECEKCKRKTDSEKVIRVSQLPEVLCVHLKRFRYDGTSGWSGNKNTKPVTFDLDCLDMAPFLATDNEEGAVVYAVTK